jgi:hypothetical protein
MTRETNPPLTFANTDELHATKTRFEEKIKLEPTPDRDRDETPCWRWDADTRNGYGRFWLQGRLHSAHRVAYQLYTGEIPDEKPCIHHDCGNTWCVNPAHLTAVTARENSKKAWKNGRLETPGKQACIKGGENSTPPSENTVSPSTAAEIRREYERTEKSYRDLAEEYDDVGSKSTIGRIIRREREIDHDHEPHGTGTDTDGFDYVEADRAIVFSLGN